MAFLRAGGDFANGIIAYEGKWMGVPTVASFDRRAVMIATSQGYDAQRLS